MIQSKMIIEFEKVQQMNNMFEDLVIYCIVELNLEIKQCKIVELYLLEVLENVEIFNCEFECFVFIVFYDLQELL